MQNQQITTDKCCDSKITEMHMSKTSRNNEERLKI